jgi:AcrR family transcriptional regulator
MPSIKKEPIAPTARDRIVETAARLFESQGYAATGINQIIAESKTAKASFYDYFPSKELLGKEYLTRYGRHHIALIQNLIQRSASPRDFLASWVKLIKRQLRSQKLYGCPMANLRAQIGSDSPLLVREIQKLTAQTLATLAHYLQSENLASDSKMALLMARRVFAAYEGAIHLWQLTGEAGALDDIEYLAQNVLQ